MAWKNSINQPGEQDTNMEPTINDVPEQSKAQEVQTSIDIKDDVCTITLNLLKGPVNAYGTCEFAKEMVSRYFLTKEIQKKRMEAEEDRGKVRVILPKGVKL